MRHDTVRQVLDLVVSGEIIEAKLAGLGCQLKGIDGGWHVKPPSHRFDLAIEADLVEEIARLIGYDNLPANCHTQSVEQSLPPSLLQ